MTSMTQDFLQLVPAFTSHLPPPLYPMFWHRNKRTKAFVQTNMTWYIKSHPSPTLCVCRYWKVMTATKLPPGKADVRLGRAASSPAVPLELLVLLLKGRTELKKTQRFIQVFCLPQLMDYIMFCIFCSTLGLHFRSSTQGWKIWGWRCPAQLQLWYRCIHTLLLWDIFSFGKSPDTCTLHLLSAKACQRHGIGCSHLRPSYTSCLLSLKDK